MSKLKKKKALVLLSGGVDSAVAATLLRKQGFAVTGVFMIFGSASQVLAEKENKCCSLEAQESARRVAACLAIPFYTINLAREFQKKVINYFLAEYKNGRTPNPCVACNQGIKFGVMLERALALGFDFVASGHYIRKESGIRNQESGELYQLLRAKDQKKDQSYFLYTLTQEKLEHLLFPLGNYTKAEVRALARKEGLPVFSRAESQDLCFVGGQKVGDFLKQHLQVKTGKIVEIASGEVIGTHKGLPFYTIGQRKNIGIGGIGPFYVARLDLKKNILYVTNYPDDPHLFRQEFFVKKVNWVLDRVPKLPVSCQIKIRYNHKAEQAVIQKSTQAGVYLIRFCKRQRAITPSQAAVFYQGREMLGGGAINLKSQI